MNANHAQPDRAARFMTTRWSMVRAAGNSSDDESNEALETLCRQYWFPVYAHTRRKGRSESAAEDLTQEFFARLIERDGLGTVDPQRGRFRNYLLGAVDHFLANQHDREKTLKRGGNRTIVSIDRRDAEDRLMIDPAGAGSPEQQFERSWALVLLERIEEKLRDEYTAAGREELFARLRPLLPRNATPVSHHELAGELKMSTGAVKVALHRMRQRFGRLLRAEILQTVTDSEEVDDEIRWLHKALSNGH